MEFIAQKAHTGSKYDRMAPNSKPEPTSSGRVLINGVVIYYEIFSDFNPFHRKPRLVYIAGTMSDTRQKSLITAPANQLLQHFQILQFDHRGMGRSSMDLNPANYNMEQFASDVDALLTYVGWESCHIMGHSFGGAIAQEVALRYPWRLAEHRLVLACCSAGGENNTGNAPLNEWVESLDTFRLWENISTATNKQMPKIIALAVACCFKYNRGLLHRDRDVRETFWRKCSRYTMAARKNHDTLSRLPGILCSTLVIAGKWDQIALPDNCKLMVARLPDARFFEYQGGHPMLMSMQAIHAIIHFLLMA